MPDNNNTKFEQLRQKHPFFIYEKFDYTLLPNGIHIRFLFNLSDKYSFSPEIIIAPQPLIKTKNIPENLLQNIIFHIGMIELLSYWKAACSPEVIIKPYKLSDEQINWWKKLYFNGLGEFFYVNGINTDIHSFMTIRSESNKEIQKIPMALSEKYIVPVGGGKDSVVTLELLKKHHTVVPMVVNHREATRECISLAGFDKNTSIEIKRTIHPQLLELNAQGYLNGHTPFSALLAFVSVLTAVLCHVKNIALSNEASANEASVLNSQNNVNHQYSKSIEFESDFREYLKKYIYDEINYFSFLRPLNELQIAAIFSKMPKFHKAFKSCNVGSKEDKWCCACPKCLFAYIILSPFISAEKLIDIFGEDLFEKQELMFYLQQMIGIQQTKPFECVGTVDEVNAALLMTLKKYNNDKLPLLLKYYKNTDVYNHYKSINHYESIMKHFYEKNYLNASEKKILTDALQL